MSSSDYNFQKELEATMRDTIMDRSVLLEQIFKSFIAKTIEYYLDKKTNRLEMAAMKEIQRNLISEFRAADIGEWQKSIKWYEDTFDTAMQEILNDASLSHSGLDEMTIDKTLEINPNGYINNGGLYIPDHLKN